MREGARLFDVDRPQCGLLQPANCTHRGLWESALRAIPPIYCAILADVISTGQPLPAT